MVGVNVLLKKIVYPGGALGFECMANTICTWRNKKRERWREKRSWFKAREGRVEPYKTTAKKFGPLSILFLLHPPPMVGGEAPAERMHGSTRGLTHAFLVFLVMMIMYVH